MLDAFSLDIVFSIGVATANRRKDQKRFSFILKQTTPKLRKINEKRRVKSNRSSHNTSRDAPFIFLFFQQGGKKY